MRIFCFFSVRVCSVRVSVPRSEVLLPIFTANKQ